MFFFSICHIKLKQYLSTITPSTVVHVLLCPGLLLVFEIIPFLWSVHIVRLRTPEPGLEKNGLYDIMQNISHYTGTGTLLFPIVLVPVPVPVSVP